MSKRTLLLAMLTLVPSVSGAQMADNGGTTLPANTSAFGQAVPFENVTTVFEGVTFTLRRLIVDPTDAADMRLIGTLTNTGDQTVSILLSAPQPFLVDELGNQYVLANHNGIANCSYSNSWSYTYCDGRGNPDLASRLAKGIPIPLTIGFVASGQAFSKELADLSNTVTLRLSTIYTIDEFQNMVRHEIVVPSIPLPR